MSNRGNGLAIVALIVGLGGAALGVYSIFIMPNIIIQQASGSSEITQIWTKEQQGYYDADDDTYSDITGMDQTITVRAGETVYVMFNAQFSNGDNGNGFLKGQVRIMLDDVEVYGSERRFLFDEYGIGSFVGTSMTTHCIIEDLTAGSYKINVEAIAYAQTGPNDDRIEFGLLLVYTYI